MGLWPLEGELGTQVAHLMGTIHRSPWDWLRLPHTKAFLDAVRLDIAKESGNPGLSRVSIEVIRTERGVHGGPWGHWQIAMAYAKYLSHEFHIWCNKVVREHIKAAAGEVACRAV
jgi:hypothetical protein